MTDVSMFCPVCNPVGSPMYVEYCAAHANVRLDRARRDVLGSMSGCSQPDCHACRANRDLIDELVAAARAAVPEGNQT